MEFKYIAKDTDIKALNIKPLDWDVVYNNTPYYVARIDGYMHSQGGKWGDNCYWAWPRDKEPSYENMIPFCASHVVCWGLRYEENFYVRCKWDDTSMEGYSGTMITRNGKDFYFVRGGIGYSVPKAQVIIQDIQEGPLEVDSIDFDKKLIGRRILYKGWPAIITLWCNSGGQGCIVAEYAGPYNSKKDAIAEWNTGDGDGSVKLDVIGYWSQNIDWFPQYGDGKTIKAEFDMDTINSVLEFWEYKYNSDTKLYEKA